MGLGALVQDFALARLHHDLAGAAAVVERVREQDLPVAKYALGESLTALWDFMPAVK